MLGAVGRLVRIERCERVQLITCAARLVVSSCHDCIFYLGVNGAPLLTGDNRFIQVPPPFPPPRTPGLWAVVSWMRDVVN